MKKVTCIILLCAISAFHLLKAQAPFQISLSFEKDTLSLMSIWEFDIKILNKSDSNIFLCPLRSISGYGVEYGEMILEMKIEGDTVWRNTKSLHNLYTELYSSAGKYLTEIVPNGVLRESFYCRSPLEMLRPGYVEVRVSYAPFGSANKTRVCSSPIKIIISSYKGDDLLVYNYLMTQPRPEFLLYPLFGAPTPNIDTSDVTRAEYIIKNYPKSSFSNYVMFYLNSMYALKAQQITLKSKNIQEAIKYLRLSKMYGFAVLEHTNARMKEIVISALSGLELTLFTLYEFSPPLDLEKEFTFKFTN